MNPHRKYPQRRSPRLKGYDYGQAGGYFVTICVQHRLYLFGAVVDEIMQLSAAGQMVAEWWSHVPERYEAITLDCWVVMPNHCHALLFVDDPGVSISRVVQWFKIMTTNAYIRGAKEHGWPEFEGKLWQRSFHDHIIRDERDLNNIRHYIATNPARWHEDRFHVDNLDG